MDATASKVTATTANALKFKYTECTPTELAKNDLDKFLENADVKAAFQYLEKGNNLEGDHKGLYSCLLDI